MFLLLCPIFLMRKQQTVATSSGRHHKMKGSAIRTLVAETLILAKTHGYVEKIENELEEELQRDSDEQPSTSIARWRRKGEKIFKSKYMLLTVVILCVTDCALVLGELTLDLHKVKVTLEDTNLLISATEDFLWEIEKIFPSMPRGSPSDIFKMLLDMSTNWTIAWNSNTLESVNYSSCSVFRNDESSRGNNSNGSTTFLSRTSGIGGKSKHNAKEKSIQEKIAYAFHYCSITIGGILVIETILKAFCAGHSFFHRRLEVFDAFTVIVSFLTDFIFITFLPTIDTTDFVFILTLLLPWRVIRVVNSLVVAVKDHEHFRLKLVYGRKKKIQNNLRDTENLMHKYRMQVTTLQRLCLMEGIDEWKVDQTLKTEDSTPITPSKKKFKFRFDDGYSIFDRGGRSQRCSLPSLDVQSVKLQNGAIGKQRSSLPSVALTTLKHHFSKSGGSSLGRRASLASVEVFNVKSANGDIRKKQKTGSEDLESMPEDHVLETYNSSSSIATSASNDREVFTRTTINAGSKLRRTSEPADVGGHRTDSTSDTDSITGIQPRRIVSDSDCKDDVGIRTPSFDICDV